MSADISTASDLATVSAGLSSAEPLTWKVRTRVDKFDQDQVDWARHKLDLDREPTGDELLALMLPGDVAHSVGNLLTTAGLTRLMSLLNGGGGQAMTNTATRLGVGNSSTAAAIGNTDLQAAAGAANRQFKVMDATYPSVATNVLTAKSTFLTGEANFVWSEWGLDIGAPTVADGTVVNAVLFNRKIDALGTKTSGSWALTVSVTVS